MTDRLVLDEEKYQFRIRWECDDDLGGYLCQDKSDGKGAAPKEREAWEHWAASKAVRSAPGVQIDSCSAWWESKNEALGALRIAKAALKQQRPLPEWATMALAAGWVAPKGWKA